ncbi:hypothetical protein [Roseicyclus marinus]|uniref:hypothetical protein n=1 Tax=Roseicyclus marinus TaxID=2161673 RepID=UPI0030C76E72
MYDNKVPPYNFAPFHSLADNYVDYRSRELLLSILTLNLMLSVFIIASFALIPWQISLISSLAILIIVQGFELTWVYNHNCDLEGRGSVDIFPLFYISILIRAPEKSADECWKAAEIHLVESMKKYRRARQSFFHNFIGACIGLSAKVILMVAFCGWIGIKIRENFLIMLDLEIFAGL